MLIGTLKNWKRTAERLVRGDRMRQIAISHGNPVDANGWIAYQTRKLCGKHVSESCDIGLYYYYY